MRQENESAFEKVAKIVAEGEEACIKKCLEKGYIQIEAEDHWALVLVMHRLLEIDPELTGSDLVEASRREFVPKNPNVQQPGETFLQYVDRVIGDDKEAFIQRKVNLGVPRELAEEQCDALLYFKEIELRSERLNEIRLAGIPEEFRNN